jgi:hypothetical protein
MIYPHLDLRLVSLIAGIWLVLSHGFALVRPAPVQQWMRKFPRSKVFGTFLLVVDAVWAFAIVAAMDMGEFTYMRNTLLVVIVVASFLTFKFVEKWRLLVVLLAYVLAVLGMVWVGIPYVLRDQIDWMRRSKAAWSAATIAGMLYGGLMAGFALIH